jgi:inosine-uridine nucleoside N-ribohydrolase
MSIHKRTTRRDFIAKSSAAAIATSFAARNGLAKFSSYLSSPSANAPRRIILDTDPGVDDAMAFFLALRSPELKVEAITPVSGNVPLSLTLPNALKLLEIAGHPEIPVAAGAATPLVRRLVTAKYVHGENGLAGVDFPDPKIKPVSQSAVEIMRSIIRKSPGELTIVAVGPQTNVATLLKEDSSIAPLIKEIVIMGGSTTHGNITPSAEFNFYVDPEAARIVFDSGVPITMVGLNVTEQVLLTDAQIKTLEARQTPVSQAAGKMMRATLHTAKAIGDATAVAMHDPLTVAYLIDPTILTVQDEYVQIEIAGELSAGESVPYTSAAPVRRSAPLDTGLTAPDDTAPQFKPNAKVAVAVDSDKFFKLLLSRLTA